MQKLYPERTAVSGESKGLKIIDSSAAPQNDNGVNKGDTI